jgi:hypothetical protein
VAWPIFFKFQNHFFNFFHFPLVVWPIFSKFKFQKRVSFSNFPSGINENFFTASGCQNY